MPIEEGESGRNVDTEDIERAVEERRVWLLGQLATAATRLGVELVGEVVNTYDMRSVGSRARDAGPDVWLRVVVEDTDYEPACRWEGNVEANAIRGVPKPAVLRWVDWHHTGSYLAGRRLRAEVMTLAGGQPVAPDGVLHDDPRLPDTWWHDLDHALTALAAHPVPADDLVGTLGYTTNGVRVHFGVTLDLDPDMLTDLEWTTAHADLHWANLTGPELCILDWESWRRAPAWYDTATLYCNSLLHPPTAHRIRELFPALFDTHSGRISLLAALCRYLWLADEVGDYENLNEPLRTLGTTVIRALAGLPAAP